MQWAQTRSVVAAVGLVVMTAAAGCGSEGGSGGGASPAAVPDASGGAHVAVVPKTPAGVAAKTPTSGATHRRDRTAGKAGATTHRRPRHQATASKPSSSAASKSHRAPSQSRPAVSAVVHKPHQLSARRREGITRSAARAALTLLAVKGADVVVDHGARSVKIMLPSSAVCSLAPDAEKRIVHGVRASAPWVRSVSVTVSGSGQSLGSYRSSSCHAMAPPSGSGKMVFHRTSNGNQYAEVKVTGKRWTVSWANFGGFFSVNVEQHGKPTPDYLMSTEPGTGKKTFTDGPGTFTLLISGPTWKVEVYDG